MPWINEGIRAYDEDVATKEDIDTGMELDERPDGAAGRWPTTSGFDVRLHASKTLHEELGDRYKPAYLPRSEKSRLVTRKKTGNGFYE